MSEPARHKPPDTALIALILALAVGLAVAVWRMAPPMFEATVDQVMAEWDANGVGVVHTQGCEALYYDAHDKTDDTMRVSVRQALFALAQKRGGAYRIGDMRDAGLTHHRRCVTIEARLIPHDGPAAQSVEELFESAHILRVAVRDKQPSISARNANGQWRGAAIDFARSVARELGREARFTPVTSAEEALAAIRFGIADIAIARIVRTPERAVRTWLSDPYFFTGQGLASFQVEDAEQLTRHEQLNRPHVKIVAVKGSVALNLARKRYPKAVLVPVSEAKLIPAKARWLRKQYGDRHHILVAADEWDIITWPDAYAVRIDGKPLLSRNDHYAAAAASEALRDVVNHVIAKDRIIYSYRKWLQHIATFEAFQ
ncbi:substrate-binding periplasmic protein [Magnetofaba australis]|uniref:Solute-binding protein family 3/N-terminal domain-containing protein n=1 Tax=Magnetofaba australis IT-1 TaxID=1434232 RepID=A0A1Y2K324_9PROT|nr:transporter substrate-binding domain-containing protein [Magnetofaba australis]OSM01435.1 hypothetical protein MAIT1_01395 [Magnetofaba australis IT-1]